MVLKFNREKGLYERLPELEIKQHRYEVAIIHTIHQEYEGDTKHDDKGDILARETQLKLVNPLQKVFMKLFSSKSGVKSIFVKTHAITNVLDIYGPDLPGVLGKQLRNQPPRVETGTEYIPNYFHRLQQFVTVM